MNILKWIFKFIKVINSNRAPGQVAGGIAFAFMLALIPFNNLLWIALFVLTFFLKVHNGTESLFLIIFKLFIFIFDPLLDAAGFLVLNLSFLRGFFAFIASLPLMLYTHFNNTLVMGGFVLGIILWLPLYFLFIWLVKLYRNKIKYAIANSKFGKWFIKLPVVSVLSKVSGKLSGGLGTIN